MAVAEGIKQYDPQHDPNAEGDPYKTLFISGLSYDVTDKALKKAFSEFGPIKRVKVVHDKKGARTLAGVLCMPPSSYCSFCETNFSC